MLKEKKHGTGLEFRTFEGKDGHRYLVFRTQNGGFHCFVEVEAKQAARECGAADNGRNTQTMWEELWNSDV